MPGPSASGTIVPGGPMAPGSPASPGACPSRSLSVTTAGTQGTAGSTYTNIVFTNKATTRCTLYGYPGVSFTTKKSGVEVQIGAAAARSGQTAPRLVTLKPGAAGHAVLQIVDAYNYPAADCGLVTADYLQIYPPGQTTPIYYHLSSPACSKPVRILVVGVVQPGTGS
ncbi:MAG: DUF4232 domain-containing protein [Frankia sp.]